MHLHQNISSLVEQASARIGTHVRRTYLEHSVAFSELTGANVFFKCENLQFTGSFKLRGAMNKFLSLSRPQQEKGVVAASTGNHGKAVAYSANRFDSRATVFVPTNSDSSKTDGISRLGAHLQMFGTDCVEAEQAAKAFANEHQISYVSPYNDPDVIAGQGTIGLEICKQLEPIDAVYASMGGAGLITGIGAYVKSQHPNCQLVGCSPKNSQVMIQSLQAGRLLDLGSTETISDGTAGGVEPGSITFELCQQLVDQCVTVSETEIRDNLCRFIQLQAMLIEGAAAVAIAGLIKTRRLFQGKNVVVVLCGANIGVEKLGEIIRADTGKRRLQHGG